MKKVELEVKEYVAPQIEVVEVMVERGFAGTEGETPGTGDFDW